jgi:hypothetical protein
MIVYSYTGSGKSPENIFSDESPIQFLKGFSMFYNDYHGNEVKILYSEKLDAYIPIF